MFILSLYWIIEFITCMDIISYKFICIYNLNNSGETPNGFLFLQDKVTTKKPDLVLIYKKT